jgi:hypothetical protein
VVSNALFYADIFNFGTTLDKLGDAGDEERQPIRVMLNYYSFFISYLQRLISQSEVNGSIDHMEELAFKYARTIFIFSKKYLFSL